MSIAELIARQLPDNSSPVGAAPPNNAQSRALVAVPITFIILSTTAVILRITGRRIRKATFGWDDYTIFAAFFCTYVMCISVVLQSLYGGGGRHAQDIDPRRIGNLFKILVVLQIFFGLSNGLVKCSICLLYVRLFGGNRRFRIMAWSVMAVCAAWGLMVVLTGFLLCTPFVYNWDHSIQGHCADQKAAFVTIGALDIVTDLMILSLPVKTLWSLQMRTASKIALTCIFGLGCFTIIVSCFRIATLLKLDFQDITYSNTYPFLWSCIEPATGVICACAPVAKPVFGKLFENRSTQGSKRTASSGGERSGNSWVRVRSDDAEGGGKHALRRADRKLEVNISQSALELEDEWVSKDAHSDRELWMPLSRNDTVASHALRP